MIKSQGIRLSITVYLFSINDCSSVLNLTFLELILNNMVKNHIQDRKDVDVLLINYNDIISNTMDNICKIIDFLGMSSDILDKMMSAVVSELYRQRRT